MPRQVRSRAAIAAPKAIPLIRHGPDPEPTLTTTGRPMRSTPRIAQRDSPSAALKGTQRVAARARATRFTHSLRRRYVHGQNATRKTDGKLIPRLVWESARNGQTPIQNTGPTYPNPYHAEARKPVSKPKPDYGTLTHGV